MLPFFPLFLIGLYQTVLYNKVGTYKISEQHSIVVSQEGFLGCGENLRITETKFLIFDKEIDYVAHLCLTGISNIQIQNPNIDKLEILIEHDETRDSENPYNYKFKDENE